ncbi:unnamed protein product [Paramecium sonneborni]|uniref:Uncharacterized protein n=1 Tax=Paramecium sonneborni TaxID=65129 RepID=A0A8S1QQJ8_9CILI|nr:unnamed protein product [Paramecium sonneborni]
MIEYYELDLDSECYVDQNQEEIQIDQNYIDDCQLNFNFEEDGQEIQREQIKLTIDRQIKIPSRQIQRFDESIDINEESIEEIMEQNNDEQINDNESEEIQESLQKSALKSTEKIKCDKIKQSNQQVYSTFQIGSDDNSQVQEKQKHQQQSQGETKNLPNYYGRQFVNKIRRKLNQEQDEQIKSEMNQKLEKLKKKQKMFTLKQLREMLDEEYFREESKNYLTSFEFLHDLMQSDKQQDIRPPIKYAKRMYEGCVNRQKLYNWKEV